MNGRSSMCKSGFCAVIFTLALTGSGCGGATEADADPARAIRKTVRVGYSRSQVVRPALDTFGILVYHSKADIYPGIDGTIEQILVEEGQRVERGEVLILFSRDRLLTSREQILAEVASKQALLTLAEEKLREGRNVLEARTLEIRKAEAELAQARAEFDNISQIYSNKKLLFEAGGISEGELKSLHTRFIAARMEFNRAEKELEIRQIGFRDRDILARGLEVPADEGKRLRLLMEINSGTLAAQHQVAQAELGAAQAELRRINMLLDDAAVTAPIDGIVGIRYTEIGEKADRETLLLTLFNTDTMYARIEVAEAELQQLRTGQTAELIFEGEPAPRQSGTVELISPYIDPQSRTARVRVHMDNSEGTYIPGMFARIRIFTGEARERVTVPMRAIGEDFEALRAGEAEVWVVRNARAFRRQVHRGQREGDRVVVLSGLESGEAVVLDPTVELRDGMEVEVLQ